MDSVFEEGKDLTPFGGGEGGGRCEGELLVSEFEINDPLSAVTDL